MSQPLPYQNHIDRRAQVGCPGYHRQARIFVLPVLLSVLALGVFCTPAPTSYSLDEPPPEPQELPAAVIAETYYIRPDGGNAKECTGVVDAPYLGAGNDQPCAWDHPFRALPPGGTARIPGGSTLEIAAGSYAIGYGAPGSETGCEAEAAFDCTLPPLPSGLDAEHPTQVLGAGWEAGCPDPPELWGTQRVDLILNLSGASHVRVACLEITDHSECVEFHSGGLACERDAYPYGEWAATGLYAQDSSDVTLQDLFIHGLATNGIHAGRLENWTVENLRLRANGWAGWDGDIQGDDSNQGSLAFRHWIVEWNGCAETYPGGEPTGCWAQTAGGYGDGVGTGDTGGDWLIEDSAFLHNTSDGLDLLYHTGGGEIRLDRVRAEGNAGNQVKVTGQASLTNSLLVGNCAFFEGQPFTFNVDPCRALGNTLEAVYTGGETITILNSTLYGQGDGLVGAGPREGFRCRGDEKLLGRNNIYLGDHDFFDPEDLTFLFYQEGCGDLILESDYGLAWQVKNTAPEYVSPPFPSANNQLADPQILGPLGGEAYGLLPGPYSPALDAGDAGICPPVDLLRLPRPADGDGDGAPGCDLGAYEVQPTSTRLYLPLAMRN